MRIRKIDSRIERNILIGLIMSDRYISFMASRMEKDMLRNRYAQTICSWCLAFFKKYQTAPKFQIKEIYEYKFRCREVQEDETSLIEKLLEEISQEYSEGDEINVDFLLDKTEEYFKKTTLERLLNKTQNLVEEGNVKEAEIQILNAKPIKLTTENGIDPLADLERIKNAFETNKEPLFTLPGAFGELLNEHLTRDSFVCFQAPEKTGKTWLLYHLAQMALKAGKKVAIFAVGDMTESQSIVRLGISFCKKSNKRKYCGAFDKPVRFVESSNSSSPCPAGYEIETEKVEIKSVLTPEEVYETYSEFLEENRGENNWRLFTRPADSMNFTEISAELEKLELEEDFVADVVVVDYMDLMAAEDPREIGRDKINSTWKKAKSLNNAKHNLLISATQADAGTYSGELQSRQNYSEDKRKYSHVNVMVGLSQTDEEKKAGIIRANNIVAREGEFVTSSACYVLQSLRTGEPLLDSVFCSENNHRRRNFQNNRQNEGNQENEERQIQRRRPRVQSR